MQQNIHKQQCALYCTEVTGADGAGVMSTQCIFSCDHQQFQNTPFDDSPSSHAELAEPQNTLPLFGQAPQAPLQSPREPPSKTPPDTEPKEPPEGPDTPNNPGKVPVEAPPIGTPPEVPPPIQAERTLLM